MQTVENLVNEVKGLVSLPEVYLKIRELYADPESSIKDFEQVVSVDPGLSARVLKIGNSAFFGFATKIDSITRALMIMGTAQLHDLVLATSAIKAFDGISNEMLDMNTFWRRSIHCGVMARLLGTQCNVLDTDRLFLIGLLHDIGHLVIYSHLPNQASDIVQRSREEKKPTYLVEREVLGFDYADVGSELMRSWALAETIVDTVAHHLTPGKATTYSLETSILHMANAMAIKSELDAEHMGQVPVIVPVAWKASGLSEESLQAVDEESASHVEEAVSLFLPSPTLKLASAG